MSKRIAGVYELGKEIGAGGGGVVYLGEHIRLKKKIILKADKRSLRVKEEKLRREVDILKNLSHTYIPHVYDFVPEDGVVYTVMDYIEGESLDKLLARGQLPAQPQMIQWACQLLEALVYLHNQSPHGILHGDIKPANIMLKPNGDVCLIDFNIALALGEDGAVRVGFSRGYASPEHYGADYISRNKPASAGSIIETQHKKETSRSTVEEDVTAVSSIDDLVEDTQAEECATQVTQTEYDIVGEVQSGEDTAFATQIEAMNQDSTQYEEQSAKVSGSQDKTTTEGKKGILLDVRSDIYCLGATLYHMISGQRPAQDARNVGSFPDASC